MNKIRLYQFQDEQLAKKYAEFRERENPTELSEEIHALRAMAEIAANQGDFDTYARFTAQIGKLSQITEATNIRRGELLQKGVVLQLALETVRIQMDEIRGKFPGWEECMDRVRQKTITLVSEAKNPDPTEK